jgi:hypothetical protein
MTHATVNRDAFVMAFGLLRHHPKPLNATLRTTSVHFDIAPLLTSGDLFTHLRFSEANDRIRLQVADFLATCDYVSEGPWAVGTSRSTPQRRQAVYTTLDLTAEQRVQCDEMFPRFPAIDPPIVIAEVPEWTPWYTEERKEEHSFYWPQYRKYLGGKGWSGKNLAVLDSTTDEVVRRIADPSSGMPFQTKGLVVGYVQSGKTAHFTGVIAKAVDAGYRLVIVLAGTINILREQTQRRLDKELIGWELVHEDYEGDPEQLDFIRHGGFPSGFGSVNWERLTLAKEDFRALTVGISALEFRRTNPSVPFYNPANLFSERARLIVVKKNSGVLGKLLAAIRRAGERNALRDIPTLIIDDESDQASINTKTPKKTEVRERTAINGHLVTLLEQLDRAQYIGYTATPFANVFIDPDDASDLFPSDFLISLPKPEGYMGVADFYDATEPVPGDYSFNKNAFVRQVIGDDNEQANLPAAIDAYVLAGAVKCFRENDGGRSYRHHTMLVHHSTSTLVHRSQADRVQKLYEAANYVGGGPGLTRLRLLWESDFLPVCLARGEASLSIPASFEQLRPFVGECCRRINEGEKPVLVVNGDDRDDTPNFERNSVWKIIVGGTKLSRGYTVEGLTVSYYRRTAKTADTLMQMGRWFGYRAGYQDLVRLYIGTREPLDKRERKHINLYEAFYAICRDEEEFRTDLDVYSKLDGDERITPKQIPPLVPSHMLKPTAKNKMYNAVLDFENYGGRWIERTVAPTVRRDRESNEKNMQSLLRGREIRRVDFGFDIDSQRVTFDTLVCLIEHEDMLEYLRKHRWAKKQENTLLRVIDFLEGKKGDPEIDRWLFVAPQRKAAAVTWSAGGTLFDERIRDRVDTDGRYGVYSEPDHKLAAEYLAGKRNLENVTPDLALMRSGKQAVFVFYPVRSKFERDRNEVVTMGFGLQLPVNGIPRRVRYTVRRHDQADAVTVEAS